MCGTRLDHGSAILYTGRNASQRRVVMDTPVHTRLVTRHKRNDSCRGTTRCHLLGVNRIRISRRFPCHETASSATSPPPAHPAMASFARAKRLRASMPRAKLDMRVAAYSRSSSVRISSGIQGPMQSSHGLLETYDGSAGTRLIHSEVTILTGSWSLNLNRHPHSHTSRNPQHNETLLKCF